MKLSAMAGRQLPFFSLLVPAWLVWAMAGWRGVVGVWPAVLVSGGTFAAVQFAVSNWHGPWLVDVVAGVVSLVSLALLLRVWQPADTWRFGHETTSGGDARTPDGLPLTRGSVTSAWMPWALLTAFVFVWGFVWKLEDVAPLVKRVTPVWEVTGLHGAVGRVPPVVPEPVTEEAKYSLSWLSATGTGIALAAVVSAAWLRVSPARFVAIWLRTLW